MVEAQEYPDDYDGIWASSPAINWTKFLIAGFWPIAAANEYHAPLRYHKLNAFAEVVHSIAGGAAQYYRLHEKVDFDPFTLTGKETKQGIMTAEDVRVVQAMWEGPRRESGEPLWYGYRPGLIHWKTGLPIFSPSFLFPFSKARPFSVYHFFISVIKRLFCDYRDYSPETVILYLSLPNKMLFR